MFKSEPSFSRPIQLFSDSIHQTNSNKILYYSDISLHDDTYSILHSGHAQISITNSCKVKTHPEQYFIWGDREAVYTLLTFLKERDMHAFQKQLALLNQEHGFFHKKFCDSTNSLEKSMHAHKNNEKITRTYESEYKPHNMSKLEVDFNANWKPISPKNSTPLVYSEEKKIEYKEDLQLEQIAEDA